MLKNRGGIIYLIVMLVLIIVFILLYFEFGKDSEKENQSINTEEISLLSDAI